jgi:hypothetical protein
MFFAKPDSEKYVPTDFWAVTFKNGLREAIENFKKFEGKINKELYLYDILRALVLFQTKLEKSNQDIENKA